jgi:hypothetical protein
MFKFLKRPVYLGALRNAINAKLTLKECSKEQKVDIYLYANALYISGGRIINLEAALAKVAANIAVIDSALDRMNEYEINALYSMAMIDCEIKPKLAGEGWNIPLSNPLSLVNEFDQQDVETAIAYFWDKHRLRVSMGVGRL